ncbi:hypothetical protein QBC38DRAFT_444967 [Podospora fimiseda]|uniref:FAR1 domain-containing protein n=1 Tax=Podospora fimiseda TaxID=252190 RepID=A0AAN7BMK6_9PEZI|nr:hypothetical protein QBC38DRAFT_444967 [Podospora fimiseda]
MDTQGNTGPSQGQQRPRKRQRTTRAADAASNPAVVANASPAVPLTPVTHQQQNWAAAAAAMANNAHTHPHAQQTVRAPIDTVQSQQQPTFASQQQLDRSHQVADQDSLLSSYNTQHPHTQYPESHSTLASAPQPDTSGLSSLSSLAGEQHHTHHQQQHVQHPQHTQHPHHQTQQQQQPSQQRSNVASSANKADNRALFQQQYGVNSPAGDSSPATVANPSSAGPGYNNLAAWPGTPTSTSAPSQPQLGSSSQMAPQSPSQATGGPGLAPPVDGIFGSFEELLTSVQRHAKEQGYNIVKLRASNYREGKPTRYDLVCDRGGVKYNSTAKKRNPSTRKVDCPWRAKAVCEVNLGNRWRFGVQEHRHNHEARVPTAPPGQEAAAAPVAQSIKTLNSKVDRIPLQFDQGMARLETIFASRIENFEATIMNRLDNIDKRLEAIENGRQPLLGGNGVPPLSTPSMPTANMGGGTLGNPSMTNGGMQPLLSGRIDNLEGRLSQIEPNRLDSLQMMDDDGSRGMSMMVNS